MNKLRFHKMAKSLLFAGRQKLAPLMISTMLMSALFVPPAHGNSLRKDSNGEIWVQMCTPLRVYEINIMTGEIRYPSENGQNEKKPKDTSLNACHNACARREDAQHA